MANGFDAVAKRGAACGGAHDAKLGSRRIFAPQFKLQVLHSYRNDSDCRGNQRATARKYGIHRRQIQKWLQAEPALRGALTRRTPSAPASAPPPSGTPPPPRAPTPPGPVDLSVRRATPPTASPPPHPDLPVRPVTPIAAWDLSFKPTHTTTTIVHTPLYYPKYGYELEAPPPPPPTPAKSFRLFRPYLPEDNFEEVEATPPPATTRLAPPPLSLSPSPSLSAFDQVTPRSYCVDFRMSAMGGMGTMAMREVHRWDCLEAQAVASAS